MPTELDYQVLTVTTGSVTQKIDVLIPVGFNQQSGGTPATGDAEVGDVAAGKTFSSALLNGATGTSTKNATVPNDAPIQPASAFMFEATRVLSSPASNIWNTISLPSKSITSISGYIAMIGVGLGGAPDLNLSGNLLSSTEVNAILAAIVAAGGALNNATANLSGQTPAAPPSGQGIADKSTLEGNGWTITTD